MTPILAIPPEWCKAHPGCSGTEGGVHFGQSEEHDCHRGRVVLKIFEKDPVERIRFGMVNSEIFGGVVVLAEGGDTRFGPAVIYGMAHSEIKLIDRQLSSLNKEDLEYFQGVVKGETKAAAEGADVFEFLKQSVLKKETASEPID